MTAKLLSGLLILLSVYIGFSHGIGTLRNEASPEQLKMMSELGITTPVRQGIAILSLVMAILILFPKTFFLGNLFRAIMIVSTMALSLKANNFKFALIEIPFLLIPLVLIYLGHPFKNGKL
ncbi:hypothetical protein LZF95_02175 [Algoriphagus sp. AGSA1]|uniref:hypothetical protein n=1 Tax=Algoriphagus sp. AGSA1 TaxID=2907213 RepID=UPI001F224E65|nr:hypothetical protein [Algoriphagus sp. AGSA1]MCE7053467.1 hypothetical protein [Algoriphagus sp. AGSA1]